MTGHSQPCACEFQSFAGASRSRNCGLNKSIQIHCAQHLEHFAQFGTRMAGLQLDNEATTNLSALGNLRLAQTLNLSRFSHGLAHAVDTSAHASQVNFLNSIHAVNFTLGVGVRLQIIVGDNRCEVISFMLVDEAYLPAIAMSTDSAR